MRAIGSFVGNLMFPAVGGFVCGTIGGVAGDYIGSWLGTQVNKHWGLHHKQ